MAKLSPFVSTPAQWVEKLAQLRAERQKIETEEHRLKTKVRAYMEEKKLDAFQAESFIAKIERRETPDFSKDTLIEVFGDRWYVDIKSKLPVKASEALVIRALKEKEEGSDSDLGDKLVKHFGGGK